MRYLDANVFLYAMLDSSPRGEAARGALHEVLVEGKPAATSVLCVDEVAWILIKKVPRDQALREARRILASPNVRVLPVTPADMLRALDLLARHGRLKPRDAIHAATALNAGIHTIVSDDPDFDVVPELDRQGLGPSRRAKGRPPA